MDYTTLSLAEVRSGLDDVARQAQETFGPLDARQVNWRPDATRWSVAQCLEHLVTADRMMFQAADEALAEPRAHSMWERLPFLPGLLGRMLIRSQAPETTRRFTAPARARPAASDIAADIVERFVDQHRSLVAWVQHLDEGRAARVIMTSPFIRIVTYSVADGCRLMLAHDRRHVEQARRVMETPGFPRGRV